MSVNIWIRIVKKRSLGFLDYFPGAKFLDYITIHKIFSLDSNFLNFYLV